ncbi:hypothetical protein ACFL0X_00135 [Nanoarchaeota archaeon]
MRYRYFFIVVVFLLMFSLTVSAVPWWKKNPCPIEENTNVVFYGQTGFGGVGDLSRSWVIHFFDWWEQQDPSINYVELDSDHVQGDCDLISYSNLKMYIQPGGNAYYQQNTLDAEGKSALLDYINSGKGFLGICAGFFYTAGDYWWQNEFYDHPHLLGAYPTVEGSIREIADYDENPGYALTALSNGFSAIYYGGPTRGYEYTSVESPGEFVATYTEYGSGMPALIKYNNMLLSSVHFEAYENDGISGLSTEDRIENYKLLANSLNEVSGTDFYVPEYVNPPEPECNDGEDNDGDGLVDMADPGCNSVDDDDETNCGDSVCEGGEDWQSCLVDCVAPQCGDGVDNDGDQLIDYPNDPGCNSVDDDDETDIQGPVELVSDGFEDGNLNSWSTYGAGRVWSASTDNSYEGSWSARAKRTGAGDDSFMEITFDASGYNEVTLEYYRKRVGLDAADDFEVQYFDGTWHSLEHLGSGRANDGSFVFKSFSISTSASKVRFKCECGAVSEKCYVDNVKVVAQ